MALGISLVFVHFALAAEGVMAGRFDVVVIGGGPAGSVAGRCIAEAGYSVVLVEKHVFPRETICGEFLSGEVVASIRELGLEAAFQALRPNRLTTFTLLPGKGGPVRAPLGFSAYGIRRGKFDAMLLGAAAAGGVEILQPAEVTGVERSGDGFLVRFMEEKRAGTILSSWVVGAYGRSSPLDRFLRRPFAGIRTGYTGVKFHVPAGLLENIGQTEIMIALGPGVYCGVSHVDEGTATVCYLTRRTGEGAPSRGVLRNLARWNRDFGLVVTSEALTFLLQTQVYGTGNIFFGTRDVVEDGVLMVGDSAGVIAPLAGDGIGSALQQARLLGDLFAERLPGRRGRNSLAERYRRESSRLLAARRTVARVCQNLAMTRMVRPTVAPLFKSVPGLLQATIKATRGRSGIVH